VVAGSALLQLSSAVVSCSERSRDLERASETLLERSLHAGSEWLKFTKKRRPKDKLWAASDEETSFPSAIALPGHENLGLGRHWHFLADFAWLLTGLTYIVMLFVTPEWRRLIPTSWQIVPDAWHAWLFHECGSTGLA
jgi:thiosulfate reductase cytochrome b subunit